MSLSTGFATEFVSTKTRGHNNEERCFCAIRVEMLWAGRAVWQSYRITLRLRGPAAILSYRPVLSSERKLPHQQAHSSHSTRNINLAMGPRWVPDIKTDWPTHQRLWYNFGSDSTESLNRDSSLAKVCLVESWCSWDTGIVREPRRRGTTAVQNGSEYVTEDTIVCFSELQSV
jgi:hypothetical protein